jgi:RHH-type proline utilization regulon transcriptional repressor/proline dehydrogenase/delta 1-pyrroline-5-carboxylate dehydrogenase
VVCISPWNFPLAIFVGQVGAALVADTRVRGVIFTGSTEVAQLINRRLAGRAAAEPCALIAETGGQNAMIVDSSALPEQVVQDVMVSAFDSAGQRCSALRVLCLQEEIADRTLTMLKGAMRELRIGPPDRLSVDIGPVIDEEARQNLLRHIEAMRAQGKPIFQLPLPAQCTHGTFVAPTLIDIASLSELRREVFGPVLHVLRYRRQQLPELLAAIDATGYGLTLGIHSRIDETIAFITARARVGNIYVNRNIVGAVVGVQPFGGEGKSGTGPKAGGPYYLMRLQRDAAIAHDMHGARPPVPSAALAGLLEWAATHGHADLRAAGERYAHASPLGTSVALPGPTGERNTLCYAPRGLMLCCAGDPDSLLHQLAAVFATGNQAAIDRATAALLPDLPQPVREAIRIVGDMRNCDLRLALADSSRLAWLHAELAELSGAGDALVPVIETGARDIPLWRLVAERALCVNTTAAGGNASLMTLRN